MKILKKLFWSFFFITFAASWATILLHPDFGGILEAKSEEELRFFKLGKVLYNQKKCYGCHGAKGAKPIIETYPVISGQKTLYIQAQLADIMNGYRANGMSSQMRTAVGDLTQEEIIALATYLSGPR